MDFIDQVRLQLSTMSQQEKDQWIVDRARLVEEDGQPGFLRSLSGEGRREGRQEGRKEGQQEALLAAIKNLMVNLKLSAEQAMAALGIPQVEYENYTAKL